MMAKDQSEHCRRIAWGPHQSLTKEGIIPSPQFKDTHFGDLLQKETEQDSRAFSGGDQDQANEVNINGRDRSMQAVALSKMKRKKVMIRFMNIKIL
jgi:hypothetical protein